MNQNTHKIERIHALDALRGIMMLLGLVLHSALTYNVTFHGDIWPLKDPKTTHLFSDVIVLLIHAFRMPVFFLVAGFFGAMLFYERQVVQMVKNRISRIVFPFLVFLWLLWPISVFVFGYTNAVFAKQENPFAITLESFSLFSSFIPKGTVHLWFLYYLILITGTSLILVFGLKNVPKLSRMITQVFDWLIQQPLVRVLFFSLVTFFLLISLDTAMVEASVSLIPERNTFVYFSFFYWIGWMLFRSKTHLLTFIHYDWTCFILAIILTAMQGLTIQKLELVPNGNSKILTFFSSVIVCLFLFGVIGLFIRYANKHSLTMRYLSDASYWVYLIHLPITVILPAFIWNLALSALGKFLIVLVVTSLLCFLSYHYLVRSTFIGKFLNGRKYPRAN